VQLLRLPPEVIQYYVRTNPVWAVRAHCAAGIVVEFLSDTRHLGITAQLLPGITTGGSLDILQDGLHIATLHSNEQGELATSLELPRGAPGMHRVAIHLPQTNPVRLDDLAIDASATFAPAPPRDILLTLGDSITQGTGSPAQTYAAVAARLAGLSLHNAGIGGHRFDANSLPYAFVPQPRCITVAYGTNDWSASLSLDSAQVYLDRVRALWPATPMAVLLPIYRQRPPGQETSAQHNSLGMTLEDYRRGLREIAEAVRDCVVFASGVLLPADGTLLVDGVHPTPAGSMIYGQNVGRLLRELLGSSRA
jgi:lysophospholipase L1-like esterase